MCKKKDLLTIEGEEYFESVEVCPHCMNENIYPMWDAEKTGYIVTCKHCGEEIFLCDECLHAADNTMGKCDWQKTEYGGKCFRGIIKSNTEDIVQKFQEKDISSFFKQQFNQEADRIMEEVKQDPLVKDVKVDPDMYQKILKKLQFTE